MRKTAVVVMAFLMVLLTVSFAEAAPRVVLNGKPLVFDVPPTMENGRTLVPLRTVFETLGADVVWDDATQTVTAQKGNTKITLTIDGPALINGQPVALDVPARLIDGRTMVPLRFVSEAMDCKVNWDEDTETTTISSPAENYLTYENSTLNIKIKHPEDWTVYEREKNLVMIKSPIEGLMDNFLESLDIQVTDLTDEEIPLELYSLFFIESMKDRDNDFNLINSDTTVLAGNPAHKILYTMNVGQKNLTITQVYTVKNKKMYVITSGSETGRFFDFSKTIIEMINSFEINPASTQVSSPPHEEDVFKIGFIAPLSGCMKIYGDNAKQGFLLALEEVGYKAGRYRIEYSIDDDRCDASVAVKAAIKQITDDKVDAIIGSLSSTCTFPVSEAAQYYKVPLVTLAPVNPRITREMGQRKDYIFRDSPFDSLQGAMAARFALENLQLKTAAVFYQENDTYSTDMANRFKEAFEKGGGKVTDFLSYPRSSKDFSDLLNKIDARKPEILYLPDHCVITNLIGKQARERGMQTIFFGMDGWDSKNLDFAAMDGSYFTDHYSPDEPRPEVKEWVEKYKAKYGIEPDTAATLGYDAAKILLKAIEVSDSREPAKLKETIQNLKDFHAVTDIFSFDNDGNPVKPMVIRQIKSGKKNYVTTMMPQP